MEYRLDIDQVLKGTTYYSSDICTRCLAVFCTGAVVVQANQVSDRIVLFHFDFVALGLFATAFVEQQSRLRC